MVTMFQRIMVVIIEPAYRSQFFTIRTSQPANNIYFFCSKWWKTVPKKKKKKKKNAYANRLSLFCSLKKTSDNCMCTHSPSCHASSSGSDALRRFRYSSSTRRIPNSLPLSIHSFNSLLNINHKLYL